MPLTALGQEQAAKLRHRFEAEGYQPSHIYASPLMRTSETARIASAGWGLPIEKWDDLMETDVGVFTGLTWEEVENRFPKVAKEFAKERNIDIVPEAEIYSQRTARAQRVIDRIIDEHSNDDRALVFSHGGIIQNIFARMMESTRLWGLSVRNTAIFEFTIDVEQWNAQGLARSSVSLWRIHRFNDASHLD